MTRIGRVGVVAMGMAMLAATPAGAQQIVSPGYTFLKAVKDRDGTKVQDALDSPSTTIIQSRDDNGDTALHIVVKRRDLVWTQFMLGKGAQMNARDKQGNTPLIDAARIGFSEGAAQLLDVGAGVDLANDSGETALIIATQARDLDMVRLLLRYGADPRVQDHVAGMSALDYARRDGRSVAIVKTLEEVKPKVKKDVAGPVLR